MLINPRMIQRLFLLLALFALALGIAPQPTHASIQSTGPLGFISRVSVANNGDQATSSSFLRDMTSDGRYVLFSSSASNLVAGDANSKSDLFLRDRQTGTTTRVSVGTGGVEANDGSFQGSISADGQIIAFQSNASNLVANDTNAESDIFVHDRQTNITTRVSVDSAGIEGNDESSEPRISADGRYVVFYSHATNLVASDTNGFADVFLHDRQTKITTRISVSSAGVQGNGGSVNPNISVDARFVVFQSAASTLVANDTNLVVDIFVRDLQTNTTTRVSIDSDGNEGNNSSVLPDISTNGRFVVFYSSASNLVTGDINGVDDVFVHDRQTNTTTRVSVSTSGDEGNAGSSNTSISGNGQFVVFQSSATNLVPDDTNGFADTFLHNRVTGRTERISMAHDGSQANNTSFHVDISNDGRYIAFRSIASNLVHNDTNSTDDVFVFTRAFRVLLPLLER